MKKAKLRKRVRELETAAIVGKDTIKRLEARPLATTAEVMEIISSEVIRSLENNERYDALLGAIKSRLEANK